MKSRLNPRDPNFTPAPAPPHVPPSTHLAAPVAEVVLFAGLAGVLLQLGEVGLR